MHRHAPPTAGLTLALATLLALAACAPAPTTSDVVGTPGEEVPVFELTSDAFDEGGPIPARHTCDGEDVAPALAWADAPDGTAAYALVVDDPDARGFVHWVLADIPGDAGGFAEGEGDRVGTPGRNDFGRTGWGGPCPPSGTHRYVFTLYALSEPMSLPAEPTADAVRAALQGRVLGEARLIGTYARGG